MNLNFFLGCIKPGFTTDNYCIDGPKYMFEYNAWFSFCHVFRMSVTYIIVRNGFGAIFLWDSLEIISLVFFLVFLIS